MKINKTNKAVLQCIKEIPSGNQNVMIELKDPTREKVIKLAETLLKMSDMFKSEKEQ